MQAEIDNLHITGVTPWLRAKCSESVLKAAYSSNFPAVKPGQTWSNNTFCFHGSCSTTQLIYNQSVATRSCLTSV
jgi:hypothetical protein